MSYELRVKNKTLAAEARIIRREEDFLKRREMWHRRHEKGFQTSFVVDRNGRKHTKVSGGWCQEAIDAHALRVDAQAHRTRIVRPHRRSAHLAYCFLRGTDYLKVEATCRTMPDWGEVERMAKKYSQEDERTVAQRFAEWKSHCSPIYS